MLSRILKLVFSIFFNSILVVQILAHLPLSEINLPANVLQQFQIMISFVSFDYFEPFKYIDVGFTELWPWSSNFAWLNYDSANFILGLGSISIYVVIWLLIIFSYAMLFKCRKKIPCKPVRRFYKAQKVWSSLLTFV